jgi:hypothetical protein
MVPDTSRVFAWASAMSAHPANPAMPIDFISLFTITTFMLIEIRAHWELDFQGL